MKVFTPGDLARTTGSKYLGVLVAAKYARALNEFRRDEAAADAAAGGPSPEKMTTTSLGIVAEGEAEFKLVDRRRGEQ